MSPRFVSTLCRLRFVATLRPYALSKAAGGRKPFATQLSCIAEEGKRVGSVRFYLALAFSSLQMRYGARGLRGVLESAWVENVTAEDGGLHVAAFPFTFAGACTEAPRPPRRHKFTVQRTKGRASRPRHAATRRDRRAAEMK